MYYWVRVAFVPFDTPEEAQVREFKRATLADYDKSNGLIHIEEEGTTLIIQVGHNDTPGGCRLISFDAEPTTKRMDGNNWDELRQRCVDLTRAGKKIQAIKECRTITGMGLKEAKTWVEELETSWEDKDIPF